MTRDAVLGLWAVVAVVLMACELAALLRRDGTAGVRELLAVLTDGRVRFVLFFVGWMWLGWHFFAR
ncbi:MAG TPA: hypothetical protein VEJ44_04385 [Acidimicrobiales bacterium]|nr:hypothetical protein [Acidimicrobiales bacterium]